MPNPLSLAASNNPSVYINDLFVGVGVGSVGVRMPNNDHKPAADSAHLQVTLPSLLDTTANP